MDGETKPRGNLELAYCPSQICKDRLTLVERLDEPIHQLAFNLLPSLWLVRKHQYYYAYLNEREATLSELVGGYNTELIERLRKAERFLLAGDYRYLASGKLTIPNINDSCRQGILSDAIKETKRKMLTENRLTARKAIAERNGITIDELKEIIIDDVGDCLFVIGYTFPHIISGTKAEDDVKLNWEYRQKHCGLQLPSNPQAYLESLIKRKISPAL